MKRNWQNKDIRCPRCGNRAVDEHQGNIRWWFCRDCGLVWEEKPEAPNEL